MILRCDIEGCENEMDDRYETVWYSIEGWDKDRDGGGTNAVALRARTGRHMCNGCMERIRQGLNPLQENLGV